MTCMVSYLCGTQHAINVQRADLEAGKKPDKVVGAQAHQRMVAALKKQLAVQEKKCQEVRT